jgi:hypothetical protein
MFKYILKQIFKPVLEDIHVYTNPFRRLFGALPYPYIHFGRIGRWWRPFPFILGGKYIRNHKWILGITGKGKSKLIADMAAQLIMQGKGVAVIDPHSDLSSDILIYLYQKGYFKSVDAYTKFLYIDFGIQDQNRASTHFVPFNILKQSVDKYAVARGVVEAMKRVWPYLRDNAPHFENVLLYSLLVLIENNLPITKIDRLLTDKEYRDKLLENVTDEMVVNFFLYRYDSWRFEQNIMRESTLNKATLFTLPPVLRYSLGAKDNLLDFRKILDEGICVVFDLGGMDGESQKLIGCLLTAGLEEAALSRDAVLDRSKRPEYHVFIDEFDKFSAQTETGLSHILAQTRKFNVYLTLANQTISQTTEKLLGALQNTATFTFRVGDWDAPRMAQRYAEFDPYQTKHEIEDQSTRSTRHPMYFTPQEIYEMQTRALSSLWRQHLFVKIDNRVWKVKTRTFPAITVGWETIETLRESYAEALMVKRSHIPKTPPKATARAMPRPGKRNLAGV